MYFLQHLYDRENYTIEVNSQKIEEFHSHVTVDLSDNASMNSHYKVGSYKKRNKNRTKKQTRKLFRKKLASSIWV